MLETPTWRANADWGSRLGYDADALDGVNRAAVGFDPRRRVPDNRAHRERRDRTPWRRIRPGRAATPDDAALDHRAQIESFVVAKADRVTMPTATHTGEAIGVVRAAVGADIPVVIEFTVETDGRLPSGQALHEAIAEVDAATDGAPLHFGINCAHPDHFTKALNATRQRSGASRCCAPNVSRASHAELDEAEDLDDGTLWSWPVSTQTCSSVIPTSRSWAAAVAPTPATSKPSPPPASQRPEVEALGSVSCLAKSKLPPS